MGMAMPRHNFTNLDNFIDYIHDAVGYLEKANTNNLGDWTPSGKVVNAGYNNNTIYWSWYRELGLGNLQGSPYCACFVTTMFASGFGVDKMKKLLYGNGFHYCPTGYSNFARHGRIYSTPAKGDIVFFWSSSLKRWSHTGIVIGVDTDGRGYTTEEANTSAGNNVVVRNGGATCIKHYTTGSRKEAFGRPDYASVGISLSAKKAYDKVYSIGTGVGGLLVTANNLNIRRTPNSGIIIGSYKSGDKVYPTKKTFVNGSPWFYIPDKDGWISALYLTGWVIEYDYDSKWWYLLSGYNYYKSQIINIDGYNYFFDDNGYMFKGTVTFTTDTNGVLKTTNMK